MCVHIKVTREADLGVHGCDAVALPLHADHQTGTAARASEFPGLGYSLDRVFAARIPCLR